MSGTFILSFDCEGKWGVADILDPSHHVNLSDIRLRKSYDDIIKLLLKYDVNATFAFVGLFQKSKTDLFDLPWHLLNNKFPYVKGAYDDIFNGTKEGWDGRWAVDLVRAQKGHEIASHGGTHTPWSEIKSENVELELSFCPNITGQTFIFPRNAVNHISALERIGVVGYRLGKDGSRFSRLASEFNIFQAAEDSPSQYPCQPIPAGYFVNWRSGLRKAVPIEISRQRAKSIINDAAHRKGVAHFWTHPENIASEQDTLKVLEAVLLEAVRARDAGRIDILTQIEFCKRLHRNDL